MKPCSFYIIPLAVAALFMTGSCGTRPDSASLINDAENAYASRNYADAQALVDTLVIRLRGGESLNAEEACRVALMLVRLGEVNGLDDENTALAWQSLRDAFETRSDSLAEIIRSLPPEDQGRVMMLARLNVRRDTSVVTEYPDEYRTMDNDFFDYDSIEP